MFSHLNRFGVACGVALLLSAGTVTAGGTSCSWGSSAGACGTLKFSQPSDTVANTKAGWRISGPALKQSNLPKLPVLAKLPVSLSPIALPVSPKPGKLSPPTGWLNSGGPKWNQGGGSNGRPVMVGAVPEPETWLMMVGGMGLLGWFARRRARSGFPA